MEATNDYLLASAIAANRTAGFCYHPSGHHPFLRTDRFVGSLGVLHTHRLPLGGRLRGLCLQGKVGALSPVMDKGRLYSLRSGLLDLDSSCHQWPHLEGIYWDLLVGHEASRTDDD